MNQNRRLFLMLGALACIAAVAIIVSPQPPAGKSAQSGAETPYISEPWKSGHSSQESSETTATGHPNGKQASVVPRERAAVIRVVDGDTVVVHLNGNEEKLRLIGINTPETVDPRRPVECFGKEASARAKELLADKTVYLEADETQQNRDKYSRLLRYIFLEDGVNVNLLLIEEGLAYEYTYDYPYRYQQKFKKAQELAKNEGRGLWAADACAAANNV